MRNLIFFILNKQGYEMNTWHTNSAITGAESWIGRHQGAFFLELENFILAIVILLAGYVVSRIVDKIIQVILKRYNVEATVGHFVSTLAHHSLLACTLIFGMGEVGIKTTSIIAVLSAAGLALGLALQGSLTHLASGVLLIIFRPFKTGEYIEMGSVSGTVDKVHAFSTTLRTADNKLIVVPNGKAISSNIVNYSREHIRRVDLCMSVACDSDIDDVKKAIGSCIENDSRINTNMEVVIRLQEMNTTSMKFIIRVWTTTTEYWNVYFDLLENTKRQLDHHNVKFPSPSFNILVNNQGQNL